MTDFSLIWPVRDAVSDPWFEAVENDVLLLQKDPVTGISFFYPRARVPGHPEREPEWFEASGRGTLHSFTIVHKSIHPEFRAMTPFVIAIVALEEGPRMTSWLLNVPHERIFCDMPVRLTFSELVPGLKMPCFTEA